MAPQQDGAKISDPTPARLPAGAASTVASSSSASAPCNDGRPSSSAVTDASAASFDAEAYEQANVHAVYNAIAPHFSATRYKPWPLVPAFLSTLEAGAVGADLGCGNGKYLHCCSAIHGPAESGAQDKKGAILTVGSDRSDQLVALAALNSGSGGAGPADASNAPSPSTSPPAFSRNEVAVTDALASGLRSRSVDYALSIAAIHHFSTRARRVAAVREMIRVLRPCAHKGRQAQQREPQSRASAAAWPRPGGVYAHADDAPASSEEPDFGAGSGRFMIYAWALEQRGEGRRAGKFDAPAADQPKEQEEPAAPDRPQDVLVPWVLTGGAGDRGSGKGKRKDKGTRRRDHEGQTQGQEGPEAAQEEAQAPAPATADAPPVYQRYYHLFVEGELEDTVAEAAASLAPASGDPGAPRRRVTVEKRCAGWEKGNWWGVWQVCEDDTQEADAPDGAEE